MKHCDLAAIRARANHLPHAASVNARDMADEIEALRKGLTRALRLIDRDERDHDGATIVSLRALLPAKETPTDG